jgi:exopolysaccharide biosynthesis polyprenyl glycosylphosphotransferase
MNDSPRSRQRVTSRPPTSIDLAPLLLLGWGIGMPTGHLELASRILLVAAFIALVRLAVTELRPKRLLAQRILILGSGPLAVSLIDEIEASVHPRYIVEGVVDDHPPAADANGVTWLGPFANLADIVRKVEPARIVMAVADRRRRLPLEALLEFRVRGIGVDDALEFYERLTGKMAIEALQPSMLILSKGFRNHGAAEMTARIVSVAAAAIALTLCSPLLVAIAIAVKLDSRGPVLFVQERAGRYGRPFGLLKFRSMHPSEERPSEWVRDNADRITRLGKWLRRFRLDELPQLVNVLRGEMNLVGPRPHPTCNHTVFMERIAYYRIRASVQPGVTGWAQVRYGYANDLEEETEKMRYDLYYIKNRSLWLDARILFSTLAIMLFGQGASEAPRPTPLRSELPWPAGRRRAADSYAHWLVVPGAVRNPGQQ